mmetsp:Transcript_5202/g.9979  ORF Transcript_5202/g.9979 Transcript_5202/m.9979 type:complete len:82 (+) Transcript_5202:1108-1353(+)
MVMDGNLADRSDIYVCTLAILTNDTGHRDVDSILNDLMGEEVGDKHAKQNTIVNFRTDILPSFIDDTGDGVVPNTDEGDSP